MQAGPTVQSFVGHATERQVGKSHDQRSMLIGSLLLNRKVEAQEELADTMTPTERILQWSRQKMAAWVTVMEMRSVGRIRYIFWNINQQDLAKSVLWVMREEMLWLVPVLQSRYSQPHQKFQTPILPFITITQVQHILPKIMSQVAQPSPFSLSLPQFNKFVVNVLHLYTLNSNTISTFQPMLHFPKMQS